MKKILLLLLFITPALSFAIEQSISVPCTWHSGYHECMRLPNKQTLFQRIAGSLYAAAAGDALGKPTEFIGTEQLLFEQFPQGVRSVRDIPHGEIDGKNVAPYTDDTAMALLTHRALIQSRRDNASMLKTMAAIARAYIADFNREFGWTAGFRAPGGRCLSSVKAIAGMQSQEDQNYRWWDVTQHPTEGKSAVSGGAGCGSVMRAYPFGLAFSNDPGKAAKWAAGHSKITHGHPMALAACASFAAGTALAVCGETPEAILACMVAEANKYDIETGAAIEYAIAEAENIRQDNPENHFSVPCKYYEESKRFFADPDCRLVAREFHKEGIGWDARSAIAAVAYIFTLLPDEPEQAILLGVNTPGCDSDSIASMVGALVGARAGADQLPVEWKELVEGGQDVACLAQEMVDTYEIAPQEQAHRAPRERPQVNAPHVLTATNPTHHTANPPRVDHVEESTKRNVDNPAAQSTLLWGRLRSAFSPITSRMPFSLPMPSRSMMKKVACYAVPVCSAIVVGYLCYRYYA